MSRKELSARIFKGKGERFLVLKEQFKQEIADARAADTPPTKDSIRELFRAGQITREQAHQQFKALQGADGGN